MDFSQPRQAETIWQQLQTAKYWEHHSHPSGQRFLGSIRISRSVSEQLLDITAQNLGRVRSLTFDRLCERFDVYDLQKYWIQIITLALSEYAYYDEGNVGFWQGVCDRLQLQNTQGTQNTLREVVRQGSDLLGLRVIKDKRNEGVRCVSTLCLQSGIPQQNLSHFAQLLEELSRQYDWWDIAHAEPEDLSQLLYELCQQSHPQWGKLLTFLKSSCTDSDDEAEPVSGELLQGLAVVAQALERQGLEPAILQDAHQREQLLQNFCLPNTFFLRSWDNLIRVLTPQKNTSSSRISIISSRKKPLVLKLDIFDSMNIQLYLPEQHLHEREWKSLTRSHCKITEVEWEGDINLSDGTVNIPDMTKSIDISQVLWIWHLRSHTGQPLIEWRCQGVDQNFPVLIFDAWTGDRLVPPNGLNGKTEIICFHNRTVQLELSDGLETIDSFVPCSISGWCGQQLQLIDEQAQLNFWLGKSSQSVEWKQIQVDYPELRGIKLKRRELTYLEVPSIWYPPIGESKTINIEIEDIESRQILTASNEQLSLLANLSWQQIQLSQWIARSSVYIVKLWSGSERWSEKFELQSTFMLNQSSPISSIQVCDRTGCSIEVPKRISSISEFWLEELKLINLWPLEEVTFLLSNGREDDRFMRQADTSGKVSLNLAALRDLLPESDEYYLSYQRLGQKKRNLMELPAVSCTWKQQTIHLSGLRPRKLYVLSLWNILRPEQRTILIPVDVGLKRFHTKLERLQGKYDRGYNSHKLSKRNRVISGYEVHDGESFVSLLEMDARVDTPGIFCIYLQTSGSQSQALGWWTNIQDNKNLKLPPDLCNDYCFNILGNESYREFCRLVSRRVNPVIDPSQIEKGISSLQANQEYLPDWLDKELLHKKLYFFVKPSKRCIELPKNHKSKPDIISINGISMTSKKH